MKCPYCGNEMERGYLYGRPRTIWTPKKTRFTTLLGEKDILLIGRRLFEDKTPADICRTCHKVIIDYEE